MDLGGHTWPMVLGAAVISAGVWGYGEITHTRDRVEVIETQRAHEVVVRTEDAVEMARTLAELRGEVQIQSRLILDAYNEIRELRGKPATSFSKASEDARQRAERGE